MLQGSGKEALRRPGSPGAGPSVLVVEDDEGLRRLVQRTLGREGFRVEGVRTGGEALARLQSAASLLLLVDYTLPDMTGADLVAKMAERGAVPPFVVITGTGDERLAVDMMKRGARDYLVKDGSFLDVLPHVTRRVFQEADRDRELEEARRQLAESRNLLQTVIDVMPDAIVVVRSDQEVELANRAALGVPYAGGGGCSGQTCGGREGTSIPARSGAGEGGPWAARVFETGLPSTDIRKEVACDGTERFVEVRVVPIWDSVGRSVSKAVEVWRDITDQKTAERELLDHSRQLEEANVELERLSNRDPLTGLFNRRHLAERLRHETERSLRHGSRLCLLMLDLDHFKRVNDTLGHTAGDLVLMRVASCIGRCARGSDFAARYGGEEFCVLLFEVGSEGAQALAERLRAEVENEAIELEDGRTTRVTCSVGIAEFHPESDDAGALIERADRALYHAKETGRNRVCFL